MRKEKEDYIWNLFLSLSNESIKLSKNLRINQSKSKELFLNLYYKYQNSIKELDKDFFILDRHKLVSALYCTIIKFKYIEIIEENNCSFYDETINKQLAFFLAINILSAFVLEEEQGIKLKIILPKTNGDHPYIVHLIRSINDYNKIDIESESFDIDHLLLLSHIFFFIETNSIKRDKLNRIYRSIIMLLSTFLPFFYTFKVYSNNVIFILVGFIIWSFINIAGLKLIWKIKFRNRKVK